MTTELASSRVSLGVFRFPNPLMEGDRMSCVYVDAPSAAEKDEIARLILACQNGAKTLTEGAPACYLGDTVIGVSLVPETGTDMVVLEVSARLTPAHLTYAFVFRSRVERWKAGAFRQVFEKTRHYVLSVAENGRLDLGVYVVKYFITGSFRVRG